MAKSMLFTADSAIVGYKPDDRASLWFMPLTDVAAGTEIVFNSLGRRAVITSAVAPSFTTTTNITAGTIAATGAAASTPTDRKSVV